MQTEQKLEKREPEVRMIPLDKITDLGDNVREIVDKDLVELVESVKANGILEPLLVTPQNRLVFGFRRRRAAQIAKLESVPCIVREMSAAEIQEARLVENLQREDLSEIDEARAFKAYLETTKSTQKALAEKIGKSQPYIANRIRLLELRPEVQDSIRRGILPPSAGEILLRVPKEASALQGELAKAAISGRIPVSNLGNEVNWRLQEWRRDEGRRKRLEALPNKTCPKCKKPAVGFAMDWSSTSTLVYDDANHQWDGKTGKAVVESLRESSVSVVRSKPVDRSEGATTRSLHEIYPIVKKLLDQADPKKIKSFVFSANYGAGARLEIWFDAPVKFAIHATPHAYSTGEKTEIQVEAYDNKRRKEMKAAFHAWEKKNLPRAPPPKKTGKKADPKILVGSIAKVIPKLPRDVELLEQLRDLEAKGKKRGGVFQAIDLRIRGSRPDELD